MKKTPAIVLCLLVGAMVLGSTPARALTVQQERKLCGSDHRAEFGNSVALNGDIAVIGAPGDEGNGSDSGSAYVFTRTGNVWTLHEELIPSGGWTQWSLFGFAVAFDGDTTVIGAPDWLFYSDYGAAYAYGHGTGPLEQITTGEPTDLCKVGCGVDVDGDTAIIGTRKHGSQVFTHDGSGWALEATLPLDSCHLTLDGDTAIIGADWHDGAGAAFVFTRVGGVWTEQAILSASDGAYGDSFGVSVALDGNNAIIGASRDDDNGPDSGSAYVFTRTGDVWHEQAKLLASDDRYIHFGRSVAIDGDMAVVGAKLDVPSCDCCDRASDVDVGCPSCPPCEEVVCDDDEYCCDVAWDEFCDEKALWLCSCCASHEPGFCIYGPDLGAAFVFADKRGVWTEQANLVPADGPERNDFGCSVAIDGDTVVVGAREDRLSWRITGSAYIFRLIIPDEDGDGVEDDLDLCPDTVIPESVPTNRLGVNRWALVDESGVFGTTPPPGGGGGPSFEFTVRDTRGCSCEQIIDEMGLGWGHTKFGCSTGAMLQWVSQFWSPELTYWESESQSSAGGIMVPDLEPTRSTGSSGVASTDSSRERRASPARDQAHRRDHGRR